MSGSPSPRAAAVLVAAGRSTRMGTAFPAVRKPFLELAGRSVLEHAYAALAAAPSVVEVVVVVPPEDVGRLSAQLERPGLRAVVAGGAERADSVRVGARAVSAGVDVIAVHDAARPLVAPAAVERVVAAAARDGAALLAVAVRDTLKRSDGAGRAEATVEREGLFAAQTPQAFRAERFLDCLRRAEQEGWTPTDDASLWERYVGPVTLVEGDPGNLKLTTPADVELARALLEARRGAPA